MGKTTKPSAVRLVEILKRQDPCAWGADYVPAIKAIREEAPARSRPAQIWWETHQRYVHVLSEPEQFIALIALFHPWLFDLQEQRMLHYLPTAHPLDAHPKGAGAIRPALRGTLEVSDSLKLLKHHAMAAVPRTQPGNAATVMPFPWVGDFLLFLDDGQGAYCVNWTVKNSPEDFERPARLERDSKNLQRSIEKEQARHKVEAIYYLDGDIPTVRLTRADFDINVVLNLAQLLLWSKRKHIFPEGKTLEIVNYFKAAIGTSTPAMALVFDLARANDCETSEIKTVLHQAIWRRLIRINLFQPFLIDKPLLRETRDPLMVYAHWFARG